MSKKKKIVKSVKKFLEGIINENTAEPVIIPTPTKPKTPSKPKQDPFEKPPKIRPSQKPRPRAEDDEEEVNIDDILNNIEGVEPKTKPAPIKTPAPTKPTTPKQDPFETPPKIRPSQKPRPRAEEDFLNEVERMFTWLSEAKRMTNILNEAPPMDIDPSSYGEPHPSIRAGIEGEKETPFSAIELFQKGELDMNTLEKLGSDEFNKIVAYMRENGIRKLGMMDIMQLLQFIMRIEAPHRNALENLAKKTVKKYFGASDTIMNKIDAQLNPGNIEAPECGNDCTPTEHLEDAGFTEDEVEIIKSERNKRELLNLLSMGKGYKAHRIIPQIKDDLDRIDERLVTLYEELMLNMELGLWQYDFVGMPSNSRVPLGRSEIEFEEDEEKEEEEPRTVKGGKAQATVFPILLHEIAKALLDYIIAYNMPKYTERIEREIMKGTGFYEDEIWMKYIGPESWNSFESLLKYVIGEEEFDEKIIPYFLLKITALRPAKFIKLFDYVVNDGEKAVPAFRKLLRDTKEEIDSWQESHEEDVTPRNVYPEENFSKEEEVEIAEWFSDLEIDAETEVESTPIEKDIVDMNIQELNIALENALNSEDYEGAAKVRDEINKRIS